MTIKSLKKEKGINKRLYRDFPNSSFRLVNCQKRLFTVRLGWGSPGRPPKGGGALPGASTAFSIGSFIDKLLAVLAPGSLR